MIENELARRAAYRRTWHLVCRWRPPAGVIIALSCLPQYHRIDVTLSADGVVLDDENFRGVEQEEVNERLDFMAEIVLRKAKAAYERHEVKDDDVIFKMTMAQAERAFNEGLESALCRGKGGGS